MESARATSVLTGKSNSCEHMFFMGKTLRKRLDLFNFSKSERLLLKILVPNLTVQWQPTVQRGCQAVHLDGEHLRQQIRQLHLPSIPMRSK